MDTKVIKESILLIREAPIEYEFRTTVCRELLDAGDIREIADYIKGSQRYILQNFRDCDSVLAGEGKLTPFSSDELRQMEEELAGFFAELKTR